MVDTLSPPRGRSRNRVSPRSSAAAAAASEPRNAVPPVSGAGALLMPAIVVTGLATLFMSGYAVWLWRDIFVDAWGAVTGGTSTAAGATTSVAGVLWSPLAWATLYVAALTIAAVLAVVLRPNPLTRRPLTWVGLLLLLPVTAACLQLAGQALGGRVGQWVVGADVTWGIVRTAVLFAAASAIVFSRAAQSLFVPAAFVLVLLWNGLLIVLRGLQVVGEGIGRLCTEYTPAVARAGAAVRRGVARVYGAFPIHVYVIAGIVVVGQALFGRSRERGQGESRPQPAAANHDPYAYAHLAYESAGPYGDDRERLTQPRMRSDSLAFAPSYNTTRDAPKRPAPADAPDRGPQPFAAGSAAAAATATLSAAPTLTRPAPAITPERAPDADVPAPRGNVGLADQDAPAVDDVRIPREDVPEVSVSRTPSYEDPTGWDDAYVVELDDALGHAPEADYASEEEGAEEDLGDAGAPDVIDLRSRRERSGGRIASSGGGWRLPPLDLLHSVQPEAVSEEAHHATARLIEQTLAEYGIEVSVKEIRPGPVVTQYGIVPGWVRRYRDVRERNPDGTPARGADGKLVSRRIEEKTRVRVDHVLAREKDLALALAAPSLRFEAPVPGESFMGLEVPNGQRGVVTLRSSLESSAFRAMQQKARLPIALGLGSGGEPVITDLADMPHLLIAGSTGSGKSVCMNTIICSLLMQSTPLDLQMYLVDPKRVELTAYDGLPHLAGPVLVEVDQAVPALQSLVAEMQARYNKFQARSARNIQVYNSRLAAGEERLPYLILVIDELADLMMTASSEVEPTLCRLAQLGRAAGIHLVVATQRPSVDVLTGLIKANFPSRLSFAVSSQVDSRTVLDSAGAEKLLGRGDLLFMPTNAVKPKRLQGAYISDDEVDAIVAFWNAQHGKPAPSLAVSVAPAADEEDALLQAAQAVALKHNRVSASLLQRKLGIGYAKAASLLDHLEERGIVGPGDPGRSREVIAPSL